MAARGTSERSGADVEALRWLAEVESDMPEQARAIPFAPIWWPQVTAEWNGLVRAHPQETDGLDARAAAGLKSALVSRLSEISALALLDVMTADLTAGQRFLRRLMPPPVDPARHEFATFCRTLSTRSTRLARLYLDYPVLADLEYIVIRQWRDATVEMLTRVARHRADISTHFSVDPEVPLTGIALSAGDRHNDGRSVAVLAFGDVKLVYKPRDVRLEQLWAHVLQDVFGDQLTAPRVLAEDDGSAYGFVQFIEHSPPATPARRSGFYRNAGRTLAALYALGATDCHYENLIPADDQLVVVDAESLFETRGASLAEAEVGQESASVLDVGMLPQWVWLGGERTAIDMSALGATPASAQVGSTGWRAVNTDAMSRGPLDPRDARAARQPAPTSDAWTLGNHIDDLVSGFTEGYRALSAAQVALAEMLTPLGDVSRRLILRPTYVYAALLMSSWQPAALREAGARAEVFGHLARAFDGVDPTVRVLLDAEMAALVRLDVPMFTSELRGACTRWLNGQLQGWPGTDAIADVTHRVAAFSETDLAWQTRLIRSAVAARQFTGVVGSSSHSGAARNSDPAREDTAGQRSDRSLDEAAQPAAVAHRVHGRIVTDARRSGGRVSWLTMALLPDGNHANVQPLGSGLYDGALGVALSLHRSGYTELATAAVAPLLDELDSGDPARIRRQVASAALGFGGVGGYLRGIRWLADEGAIETALADRCSAAIIGALPLETVRTDTWLDVMGGAAGLMLPLADEHSRAVNAEARNRMTELLAVAADRLTQRQRPDGGWDTLPATAPLTGYAHGASGIALALAAAFRTLGDERYLDAAVRGLAYEAAAFDSAVGNWPDFRAQAGAGFMLGWCAGAPGIGLARVRLLELLPDHPAADRWRRDLEAAAAVTAAGPLLDRDHVCCGNLGRAAILRTLGAALGDDQWCADADRLTNAVAGRCGVGLPRSFLGATVPDVVAVPGLMTGLAGAGLVLSDHAERCERDWVSALLL